MKKSGLMVNRKIVRSILILLMCPLLLYPREKVLYKPVSPDVELAWLTGPLIAPSAHAVPLGHFNIEPYLFAQAYTGFYNNSWEAVEEPTVWSNYLQVLIQIGLTSWLDFQFSPTVYWNYSEHEAKWVLGDLPTGIDIQLYTAAQGSWIPSLKLALKENVPLGKYRNLNPKKNSTDAGGTGSWTTGVGVVLGNIYHITGVYYLNYRLALNYNIPAAVHLKGFNLYGGGFGTDVRFFPSKIFQADLGLEMTLAQTWALALDIIGDWGDTPHHSGKRGISPDGTPARIGRPAPIQYLLAPAFEYNWNANIGAIAGAWFTFAGKNSPQFYSGVAALNIYY